MTSKSSNKDLPLTSSKRLLVALMPVPKIALLLTIVLAMSSTSLSDILALTFGL